MRAHWLTVCVAGAALAFTGCGDDADDVNEDPGTTDTPTAEAPGGEAEDSFEIQLDEQAGSGLSGTARFTTEGDGTRVVLQLDDDTSGEARPAHVHDGTCRTFDPSPAYPLENVVNGRSETMVDASLEELRAEPYIVNVHRSEAKVQEYVACGSLS